MGRAQGQGKKGPSGLIVLSEQVPRGLLLEDAEVAKSVCPSPDQISAQAPPPAHLHRGVHSPHGCLPIQVLDIPRVLDMLRRQRMMMVQTLCQYTFVYRVLIQFLKSSRLI